MKRRGFIKYGIVTTSGIVFTDSLLGRAKPVLGGLSSIFESRPLDDIFQGFRTPPAESRPFVRWWWNGNRLSKKEILRELDVMKKAGIGGVEINPIAFPQRADPVGYNAMTIFEEEWLEMLQVALKGAKERGMVCDMIVGSGWPFGGEFLKKEEQSQMLTIETLDLQGGKNQHFKIQDLLAKVDPNIHSRNETVYKDLLMVRLLPAESVDFVEGIDLMDNISKGELIIDVPEGNHVLYYVVKLSGYMAVINGAPGAGGPVLNHYNKEAVKAYLDRTSDFISSKIGNMGNYIRAMFCDSMELEGANWNDDIPLEFEKRRAYSLLPYLPFVLKKVGHMGNPLEEEYGTRFSVKVDEEIKRVELDFYRTRIELFKERFIDTFNDWCHKNNVQSRMQAYGRGMHPLEASMEIDIPECETWLFKDVGTQYPDTGLGGRAPRMCNKYVASGAALAGKRIVSCEEITNTAMVFMASLEHIKIAGDQSNISGVNHSILHGFNYSPPEAPFPGWIRYGTYFNEQNTWWPYFRLWSDYKSRISYLLQNANPQANVGILQPLVDLWLKHGPQRDPFPQKWYPEYQNNLWEAVHQNGGGCDYVSENIINNATFEKGRMIYKERSYSSLLLPEIETLDAGTARSLTEFVKSGGKVVFLGRKPFKSPTYTNGESSDAEVRKIVDDLMKNENVIIYPAPTGDVIPWYRKLQDEAGLKPYVSFDKPQKYLSQSTYLLGEHKLFFIANTSLSQHISVNAEFHVDEKLRPWIWNPETGEKMLYPSKGNINNIQLELPRATSVLIVFESQTEGEQFKPVDSNKKGKELTGSWELHFNHVKGDKMTLELDSLSDLTENKLTLDFAGEVIYEKTLQLTKDKFRYIDLGEVKGISELSINGKLLGTRWYGAHIYDLNEAIKEGENILRIKLTTIIGNYIKSLKNNPVAMEWTGRQEYFPMGLLGPVRIVQ
jgi:hypothetical protein